MGNEPQSYVVVLIINLITLFLYSVVAVLGFFTARALVGWASPVARKRLEDFRAKKEETKKE